MRECNFDRKFCLKKYYNQAKVMIWKILWLQAVYTADTLI